jgi:hypothetical protein
MGVCELNPEDLGSLKLKAFATWGENILAESLHDWARRALLIFPITPWDCLTIEERHGKLRQGNWLLVDTGCCVDLVNLLGQPRLAFWASILGCVWVASVAPWLVQVPSKLSN